MQLSNNPKRFEDFTMDELIAERDRLAGHIDGDADFVMDSLLEHIYANPLGRLLRVISTLPEVRREKVDHARRMIQASDDQLDDRMDLALDKVLEEIITES